MPGFGLYLKVGGGDGAQVEGGAAALGQVEAGRPQQGHLSTEFWVTSPKKGESWQNMASKTASAVAVWLECSARLRDSS